MPIALAEIPHAGLLQAGYQAEYHADSGVGHAISPHMLHQINATLVQMLSAKEYACVLISSIIAMIRSEDIVGLVLVDCLANFVCNMPRDAFFAPRAQSCVFVCLLFRAQQQAQTAELKLAGCLAEEFGGSASSD